MLTTEHPAKRLRALMAVVLTAMLLFGCVQSESPSDEHLAGNETENDDSNTEGEAGNGDAGSEGDGTSGDDNSGDDTGDGNPGGGDPGDEGDPGDGGDPEKMFCPRPA